MQGGRWKTAAILIGSDAYNLELSAAKESFRKSRNRIVQFVLATTLAIAMFFAYFRFYSVSPFGVLLLAYCIGTLLAIWIGKLMLAASRFQEPSIAALKAASPVEHHKYIDLLEEFRQRLGRNKGALLVRHANGSDHNIRGDVRRAFLADHGRLLVLTSYASGRWKFVRRFNRPNGDIYASGTVGYSPKLFTSRDLLTMPQAEFERISQAMGAYAVGGGKSSQVGSDCLNAITQMRQATQLGKSLTETFQFLSDKEIGLSDSKVEKLSSAGGYPAFNNFLASLPLNEIL